MVSVPLGAGKISILVRDTGPRTGKDSGCFEMMKKLILALSFLILASSAYTAAVYKWVDKEGAENFTDDYDKVPSMYRNRVEEFNVPAETPATESPRPSMAPLEKRKGVATDIYGGDETWWREKVRPWKEQLKEATKNYEDTHKELMEQIEILGKSKFASLTQYQMIAGRINALNTQLTEQQARIAQAKEMLEELSKEAEEAKANPDWLK